MLGMVLCAFFAFGVMTGFSGTGRELAMRLELQASAAAYRIAGSIEPLRALLRAHASARTDRSASSSAVAMVERRDGFYALFPDGELRGPLSPGAETDLPILSGGGIDNANGAEIVDYAALLVRAEAQLSQMVSEMRIDGDGGASLFLDHPRAEVVIDLANAPIELDRANQVLHRWEGREQLIAVLDMTTPDQAVVRLRGADSNVLRGGNAMRAARTISSGGAR